MDERGGGKFLFYHSVNAKWTCNLYCVFISVKYSFIFFCCYTLIPSHISFINVWSSSSRGEQKCNLIRRRWGEGLPGDNFEETNFILNVDSSGKLPKNEFCKNTVFTLTQNKAQNEKRKVDAMRSQAQHRDNNYIRRPFSLSQKLTN